MKKSVFFPGFDVKKWYYSPLCIFFILAVLLQNVNAQNLNISDELPDYQEGKIYLKIKDNYNIDLLTIDTNTVIFQIFQQYQVTDISKPFAILNTVKMQNTYRLTFSLTNEIENLIEELITIDYVEYAEKVPADYLFSTPNDPQYANQYHLPFINAEGAWDIHTSSGNAIVAIVDDAVLTTHEDLAANIYVLNRDVADNDNDPNPPFSGATAVNGIRYSHGTHVAGIAGAVTNNNIGVASIGGNISLMGIKTVKDADNPQQVGLPYAYDGVDWAAGNGAHVINMSWGSTAYSETNYNVITDAKSMGAILVAAAGNSSSNNPIYPAAYGEGTTGQSWETIDKNLVVAVASLDVNNNRSSFSSFGNWVDIAAYGSDILSTIANSSGGSEINNQYASFDGTSMAAPMVSGLAGLMKSYDMTKSADDIINCILYTANPDIYGASLHPYNFPVSLGTGRVDAEAAMRCMGVGCNNPVAVITPSSFIICPGGTISLTANDGISYLWSTGETTQSINISQSGVYSLTVTFIGGCTASASLNIYDAQAQIIVTENSGIFPNDGVLCGSDVVSLSAYYGSSYLWNTGGGITSSSISTSYGMYYPNTFVYSVEITDVGGCIGLNSTVSVTIEWLDLPNVTATTQNCFGQATLTGAGANTYIWQPGNISGNPIIVSPVPSTTYTVTGTDLNGCKNTASVFVTQPDELVINLTTSDACSYDEGTATANISGGTPPYDIQWYNALAELIGTGQSITGLTEGTYSVNVTDAYGCTATENLTIINTLNPAIIDYPNGLTITSPSQNIADIAGADGRIIIRGLLTIKKGITYTINGKTIEFVKDPGLEILLDIGYPSSGVIVEEGATLKLSNNALLKALNDCNAMWQGVQVWGDPGSSALPAKGPDLRLNISLNDKSLNHGKLEMNNAEIRDAYVGVALYRTHAPFNSVYKEYGRGILQAIGSRFINNNIGVGFQARWLVNNSSTITNCTFTNNASLKDFHRYEGNGITAFVAARNVRGIAIKANTFNAHTAFASDKRGTGIVSYDASYVVESSTQTGGMQMQLQPKPNTFNNLTKGIDAYSIGGAGKNIKIKDNRFINVPQSITANGTAFDEISFNIFIIPAGSPDLNTWGINLYTTAGFLTTENTFNTSSTNDYTFGLVARNTTLAAGEAYKNTFGGSFYSATQSEQANDKLQIKCNTYTGSNTYDWTLTSGLLANQGECGPIATTSANNIFSPCAGGSEKQIFSVTAFSYSTPPAIAPVCTSAVVTVDPCNQIGSFNYATACPTIVSNPCPNCVALLKQRYNNEPSGDEKERIKAELIRAMQAEGDIQGIVDVLTGSSLPEDIKILIPTHLERGECAEARQYLEQVSRTLPEGEQFYRFYNVLTTACETNRTKEELTPPERETVREVSETATRVAVNAEAMKAALERIDYIRIPERINNNARIEGNGNNSSEKEIALEINENAEEKNKLKVYPNPSYGSISIEYETEESGKIEIVNVLGQNVQTIQLQNLQGKIDVEDLRTGIYFILLHNDGMIMLHKKITVVK